MMERKADIAIAPLVFTESRLNSNNYSFILSPIQREFSIIIHESLLIKSSSSIQSVLMQWISPTVWICLATAMLLIWLLISFSRYITYRSSSPSLRNGELTVTAVFSRTLYEVICCSFSECFIMSKVFLKQKSAIVL